MLLGQNNPLQDAKRAFRAERKSAKRIGAASQLKALAAAKKDRFATARQSQQSIRDIQGQLLGTFQQPRPVQQPKMVGRGAGAIALRDEKIKQQQARRTRRLRGF